MPQKLFTSFNLSKDSEKAFIDYANSCLKRFDFATRRARMTNIDKAIQLESDFRRNLKSKQNQRLDYYDDIEISVIIPQVDSVHGFLVDLYLTQQPIFDPVTSESVNTKVTEQIRAINFQHSQHFKWAQNLALAFRDAAKYNMCSVEVEWSVDETTEIVLDPTANSIENRTLKASTIQGNNIKRCDLYNTFYDTTVQPSKVHSDGEYIGTIERLTAVALSRKIRNLRASSRIVMNVKAAFSQVCSVGSENLYYYEPEITPKTPKSRGGYNELFDGVNGYNAKKSDQVAPTNMYEVVTLYVRIIPAVFGVKIPDADKVQIWKLTIVGWKVLVCAELVTNAHNYFNQLVCQIKEEGLKEQNKSVAELVIPIQNLTTKMYDFRVSSMRASLGGRLTYMQGSVDLKDLRNQDPTAPLAVKPNAVGENDIRRLVGNIPHTDNAGAIIGQEINNLKQHASEINRLNRPQLGQFQKGNKTLGEFREVMNNANAELRVMGILVENQLMGPIKEIIKTNIRQYQSADELMSITGTPVQIDPNLLVSALIEFKLADGLTTRDDYVDPQLLREFYAQLQADPQLAARFDKAGILVYIMENAGAKIRQFLIPAQPQQVTPTPQQPPQG